MFGQRDWILAADSQQQRLTLAPVDVSWGGRLLPARRLMGKSGFNRPPDIPQGHPKGSDGVECLGQWLFLLPSLGALYPALPFFSVTLP